MIGNIRASGFLGRGRIKDKAVDSIGYTCR